MNLSNLIEYSALNNLAFAEQNAEKRTGLIKKLKQDYTCKVIDLSASGEQSLMLGNQMPDILIFLGLDKLDPLDSRLYDLSIIIDQAYAFSICIFDDMTTFNLMQNDKFGPLYLRMMWLSDPSKIL